VAKALGGEIAATVPGVRDAWSLLERGSGGEVPATRVLEDAANTFKDVGKEVQGGHSRLIADLSNLMGELFHVAGLGQLGHILQYMRDAAAGRKHPDGPLTAVKEAVIGGKPAK
jgi:hypothetical protein